MKWSKRGLRPESIPELRRESRHTCWSELKIKRQIDRNITLIINNMNMQVRESGVDGEGKRVGGGLGEGWGGGKKGGKKKGERVTIIL